MPNKSDTRKILQVLSDATIIMTLERTLFHIIGTENKNDCLNYLVYVRSER